MGTVVLQVDAFTDRPFAGNPAAVCLLPSPADDGWLQQLAREMNLPATAFVWPGRGTALSLRWFSPTMELAFCGHGTLAAAHALWEEGRLTGQEPVRFETGAGALTATWRQGWTELDFPAEPEEPVAAPPALIRALGVRPRYTGRNRLDYLVELDAENDVRALVPDLALLRTLPTRGVIVTSRATTPSFHFVSRFFAPSAGIDEDHVTGSAHCCLGPYWGRRIDREELAGYQASPRGGVVRVRLGGDRVYLQGQAATVRRGTLLVARTAAT